VKGAVLTISDGVSDGSREDTSGDLLAELLAAEGFDVERQVVPDERVAIATALKRLAEQARVVLTTGGTGITSRDSTFEAVEALLDKRLPGFGELFRVLSYEQVGAAAMLSRAQMGIHARRIVVSLPGSPNACRLALEKLLLPELGHLVREVSR
jgi:molybdenum cofactor biosynthesis protein B